MYIFYTYVDIICIFLQSVYVYSATHLTHINPSYIIYIHRKMYMGGLICVRCILICVCVCSYLTYYIHICVRIHLTHINPSYPYTSIAEYTYCRIYISYLIYVAEYILYTYYIIHLTHIHIILYILHIYISYYT